VQVSQGSCPKAHLGLLTAPFWLQSHAISLRCMHFPHLSSSGCLLCSYFLCILERTVCLERAVDWPSDCTDQLATLRLWNPVILVVFLWYRDLNSGPKPSATPPRPFLWWVFWARVSRIICPNWLQVMILLISASWVARITGVSHQTIVISLLKGSLYPSFPFLNVISKQFKICMDSWTAVNYF
jgi:hypothetical protein